MSVISLLLIPLLHLVLGVESASNAVTDFDDNVRVLAEEAARQAYLEVLNRAQKKYGQGKEEKSDVPESMRAIGGMENNDFQLIFNVQDKGGPANRMGQGNMVMPGQSLIGPGVTPRPHEKPEDCPCGFMKDLGRKCDPLKGDPQVRPGSRWYFNTEHGKCMEMRFHGCGGGPNMFKDVHECTYFCDHDYYPRPRGG